MRLRARPRFTATAATMITNIVHAVAEASPRRPLVHPCWYISRPSVWYWPLVPPVGRPLPYRRGSPKSCVAPIVDTTMVNTIVARSPGIVTYRSCCQRDAPSVTAAS